MGVLYPQPPRRMHSFKGDIDQLLTNCIALALGTMPFAQDSAPSGHVKMRQYVTLRVSRTSCAEVHCGSSSTRQVCTCKQSRVCLSLAYPCLPFLHYLYTTLIEVRYIETPLHTCVRTLIESNPSILRMDDFKAIKVHSYSSITWHT
jgi:hypothetical protein